MLAFIDESGDVGMKLDRGSSPYFCIVAAIFKDVFNADACDRAITGLRRQLGKGSNYEFHFSHCPDMIRLAFMQCISTERFDYHAFVVNKKLLFSPRFNDAKTFYEFAVNLVCENAGHLMSEGKVVIDKSGDREFLQRLQTSLKKRTNDQGSRIVKKVIMQDSKSNNLVQLADMVCGAVARSITTDDFSFRNVLKRNGREARVQSWPK